MILFCVFDLGSVLYQRVILVSYRILEYWEEQKLPIFDMHRSNVTFFSEESGEIALSVLALSFPSNQKGSLDEARRYIFHVRAISQFIGFGNRRGCGKTKSGASKTI
jgi:hypothetical protein